MPRVANPIRTVWYCIVLPALLLNYALVMSASRRKADMHDPTFDSLREI